MEDTGRVLEVPFLELDAISLSCHVTGHPMPRLVLTICDHCCGQQQFFCSYLYVMLIISTEGHGLNLRCKTSGT